MPTREGALPGRRGVVARLLGRRVLPRPSTVALGLFAAAFLGGWATAVVPVVRQGSSAAWTALQWEQRCATEWGVEVRQVATMARLLGVPSATTFTAAPVGDRLVGPFAYAAALDGLRVGGEPVELIAVAAGVPAQRPLAAGDGVWVPTGALGGVAAGGSLVVESDAGRVALPVAGTYDGTPAATVAGVPLCAARNWIVQTDAFSEDQRGPSLVVPYAVIEDLTGRLGVPVPHSAVALAPAAVPASVGGLRSLADQVVGLREAADLPGAGRVGAASAAPAVARLGGTVADDLRGATVPLMVTAGSMALVLVVAAGRAWRRARAAELALLAARGAPRAWAAGLGAVETLVPAAVGAVLGGLAVALVAGVGGPAPAPSVALASTGARWGLLGGGLLVVATAAVAGAGSGARALALARAVAGGRRPRWHRVAVPVLAGVLASAGTAAVLALPDGDLVGARRSGTPEIRPGALLAFLGAGVLVALVPAVLLAVAAGRGAPGAIRRYPASVLAGRRMSSLGGLSAAVAFLAAAGATGAGVGSGVATALTAASDAKAAVVLGAPSVATVRSRPPAADGLTPVFRTSPRDPADRSRRVAVLGVDPSTFTGGTLPASLPEGAVAALRSLGGRAADGTVPALVVAGCCPGEVPPAELTLGLDVTLTLRPVAIGTVDWFPGVPAGGFGLVVDQRALADSPVGGWEAWSRQDGASLRRVLDGAGVRVVSVLDAGLVFDRAPMRFVSWVAAGVALVGWAFLAAAALALVLYLAVHARADASSALLLHRAGLGGRVRVRSRLVEALGLGLVPAAVGSAAALVVVGAVVDRLDSLPMLPPGPTPVPGPLLVVAGAGLVALVAVAAVAGVGDALVSDRRSLQALRRDEA